MPVPGKKHPRPSATFFSRQYSSFKSLSSMQESLGNWITNIVLFNKKINKFKNNQEYKENNKSDTEETNEQTGFIMQQ